MESERAKPTQRVLKHFIFSLRRGITIAFIQYLVSIVVDEFVRVQFKVGGMISAKVSIYRPVGQSITL